MEYFAVPVRATAWLFLHSVTGYRSIGRRYRPMWRNGNADQLTPIGGYRAGQDMAGGPVPGRSAPYSATSWPPRPSGSRDDGPRPVDRPCRPDEVYVLGDPSDQFDKF